MRGMRGMSKRFHCPFCLKRFANAAKLSRHLIYEDCKRRSKRR